MNIYLKILIICIPLVISMITVQISVHRRVSNGEGKAQKRADEDEGFTHSKIHIRYLIYVHILEHCIHGLISCIDTKAFVGFS